MILLKKCIENDFYSKNAFEIILLQKCICNSLFCNVDLSIIVTMFVIVCIFNDNKNCKIKSVLKNEINKSLFVCLHLQSKFCLIHAYPKSIL